MQWSKVDNILCSYSSKTRKEPKNCNFGLDLDDQSDKKSERKFLIIMTSAQKFIDQELEQFGWVETIATNSISDFKSPNSVFIEKAIDNKNSDLIDIFICHLIFYMIFCYSLFLFIIVDLGFRTFIQNKVTALFKFAPSKEHPNPRSTTNHSN